MKKVNAITLGLNIAVITTLVYLGYDMSSNPVNVYSDGQAGIGIGYYVLVIQFLRLFLLLGLIIYAAIVISRRSLKQKFTFLNLILFSIGLVLGYVIIN
jgi:hypothetical protein